MNESQLLDELTEALDHAAATVRAPAGAAVRARRGARRRQLSRALTAGLPAAGLAAGLVIALGGPQAPARPAPLPRAHAGARHEALTVAYVTSQAKTALARVAGWIVRTSGHGWTEWSDQATGATRLEEFGPGGALAADEGWTLHARMQHRIYVDYGARTWWELSSKVAVKPVKPRPSGVLPAAGNSASGQVRVLGHRTLAGRDTILVEYGPPRGFTPTASAQWPTELVWFDAGSYLPVRTRITAPGPAQEQDLSYLPATAANLARLTVSPPAGFNRVAPPPFRGDGRRGLGLVP